MPALTAIWNSVMLDFPSYEDYKCQKRIINLIGNGKEQLLSVANLVTVLRLSLL